jgi:hypothetical protein
LALGYSLLVSWAAIVSRQKTAKKEDSVCQNNVEFFKKLNNDFGLAVEISKLYVFEYQLDYLKLGNI